MIPVVFINCIFAPYLADILRGLKLYETRTVDSLRSLVGCRVFLAETGHGRPVIRCSAVIGSPVVVRDRRTWDMYREKTRVPEGGKHDWTDSTKQKYLYRLLDVQRLDPFPAPEGRRHGRVWMEYNTKEAV